MNTTFAKITLLILFVISMFANVSIAQDESMLIEMLKDSSADKRAGAARMLADHKTSAAITALIRALDDDNTQVIKRAAESLGKIGSSDAIDPLISKLESTDRSILPSIAASLKLLGAASVKPLISFAEGTSNPMALHTSIVILGSLKDERANSFLIGQLSNSVPVIVGSTALALGQIGSESSVDQLLGALDHSDPTVRQKAATALGLIGSGKARSKLQSVAASDSDSKVKAAAQGALTKLK